jgi:hypothetical protein
MLARVPRFATVVRQEVGGETNRPTRLAAALASMSGLEALFPRAEPSRWRRRWILATCLATPVAVTLIELGRQTGVPATSTFWAEDGKILYQGVLTHSFLDNLTSVYEGYMQLVPRIAIEFTRIGSVRHAPLVTAVGADVMLGLIALVVWHAARGHVRSLPGRFALAGSVLLLPLATAELLNDIINIPWWLLFGCFWVMLWRPQASWERWLAGLFCFATAASNPLVALFLPIALARALALPRLRENAATLGLLAGLLLQAIVVAASTAASMPGLPKTLHGVASLFWLRVVTGSVAGLHLTDTIIAQDAGVGVAVGVALFAAIVAIVLATRCRRIYLLAAFGLPTAVLVFAFETWDRGVAPIMTGASVATGSRYVQTPQLILLSVAIVTCERLRPRLRGRTVPVGAALVLLALIPAWARDYRVANQRSAGPDWPAEVAQAAAQCTPGSSAVQTLDTSPAGNWYVNVPCHDLP